MSQVDDNSVDALLPMIPAPSRVQLEDWRTPARMELLGWLARNAPSLGELYEAAVRVIADPTFPGRVRLVAHAVREIRNRLPDAISGVRSERLDYPSKLDLIAGEWRASGLGNLPMDDQLGLSNGGDPPELPDVLLPRRLAMEIGFLLLEHEAARSGPVDAAIRLFEACAPENQAYRDSLRPIVSRWVKVTGWFVRKAHDSGATDTDCSQEELRSSFDLFELTLGALTRRFYGALEELDAILEETNS